MSNDLMQKSVKKRPSSTLVFSLVTFSKAATIETASYVQV